MDDQLSDDERSSPEAPGSARGNGEAAGPQDPTQDPLAGTVPGLGAPPVRYTGPIYSLRLKLTVAVVAVAAVVAISWVYLRTSDSSDGNSTTNGETALGVENFQPSEGAQVPEQSRVGLDLTPGWDGSLTIDDVPIPESELTRDRQSDTDGGGQGAQPVIEDRLEFAPGPDKVIEELPSGQVCVTASLHQRADPTQQRTFDWCFTVY